MKQKRTNHRTWFYILSAIVILVSGCKNRQDEIVGSWGEPIPGMEDKYQGIRIEPNGKASSINMSTLLFEKWEKNDDKLILRGKSVGNRQTLPFTDTLIIMKIMPDTLALRKGSLDLIYKRIQ